jgi:integrase
MTPATFDVRVWTTHVATGSRGKSYKVRWSVDGQQRSKTLKTAKLADSFRSTLLAAVRSGEAFESTSGLPLSVTPVPSGPSWLGHAQLLVDSKWSEASPRHRQSTAEALTTITMALTRDGAIPADPGVARKALRYWSFNATARRRNREPPEEFVQALDWLTDHSRPLKDLEDVDLLRNLLAAIATNLDGTPASTSTTNRKRAALSSALVYAVERGDLDSNPLQRVKSRRRPHTDAIDARVVVSPTQARMLLSEIEEHTPALHAFFAGLYFAGLRPSEAANLRRINLKLTAAGWGEIVLLSSYQPTRSEWTDDGQTGEERSLKHRAAKATRRVPAHPELVVALQQHLSTFGTGAGDRLFVTRTGRGGRPVAAPFVRPVSSASTSRVLRLARAAAFTPEQYTSPLARRPYDLRHACVHLAGGWGPTHPSGRLGWPQRGGAAARLCPRPRRPGGSLQASDSGCPGGNLDRNRTRRALDDRISSDIAGQEETAPNQRFR